MDDAPRARHERQRGLARVDARLDQTNARLDQTNARLDQTNACLDQTVDHLQTLTRYTVEGFARVDARIDETNTKLDELARYTVAGFQEVVARQSVRHSAFERFVELSLDERRRLQPEIDSIKARLDLLERKVH